MRRPTTKDFAEYFRLALEAGLCCENEIESWAEGMIVETDSPIPAWLVSLSTEGETSKNKLLEAVPGVTDKIAAWSLLLAHLGVAARTKRFSQEQIVRTLYRWAVEGVIPKPFFKPAFNLDNEFSGIKEGWYSERQFLKDFESFFAPFRSFEPFLPQSTKQAPP